MKLTGSFTIEASLLLPFVMLIIITILEFSIYLHDSILLQSVANDALGRVNGMNLGVLAAMDGESLFIREHIHQQLEKSLIGVKESTISLTFEKNNYLLYQKMHLEIQAQFWMPLGFSFENLSIKIQTEIDQYNPMEVVRVVDFMDDATSRISYIKEIKDCYYLWLEKMKVMLLDAQ